MTIPNLISRERAKLNLPGASTSDDRTIDALIGAASAAIQKHCRRIFALQRYDEVLDGNYHDVLILREYPVQAVESVRADPETVLQVQNTDTSANQQARVTVTSTGLELVRVASGTLSRDTTVTWAANATLSAIATAVSALGNGWSAQVPSSAYNLYPSQDLYVLPNQGDARQSQGALPCAGAWASLVLHVSEVAGYRWDSRGWLYRSDWFGREMYWAGEADNCFPWQGGRGQWRVQYTAGYQEIPEDLQEACAQWVSALHYQTTRDPRLIQESSAPTGGTSTFKGYGDPVTFGPPSRVAALLAPYRRRIA